MRIVAGTWRGRTLAAPRGGATRPTADRVRQALFDMLVHAPWGGRLDGMLVLDGFAGTGAMGLEALSRGAARAVFFEQEPAALAALRANISALQAEDRCRVIAGDVLTPPASEACALAFLDPPYGHGLVERGFTVLQITGWIAPGALIVAESGRAEVIKLPGEKLAERTHGAALITIWRV